MADAETAGAERLSNEQNPDYGSFIERCIFRLFNTKERMILMMSSTPAREAAMPFRQTAYFIRKRGKDV